MRRERSSRVLLIALAGALIALGAQVGHATTICDVQASASTGRSVLEGESVTVRGVVTIPPGYFQSDDTSFYIEDDGCGVNVYNPSPLTISLAVGDTIEVTGEVVEYISGSGAGATTEVMLPIGDPESGVEIISTGNPEPVPAMLSLSRIGDEENEGRLVRTIGRIISKGEIASVGQAYFNIVEPWTSASLEVFQGFNDSTDFSGFDVGDTIDVTGFVTQYDATPPYFEGYQLAPRFQHELRRAVGPEPPDPVFWQNASLDIPASSFRPDLGEILPIAYMAPSGSRTIIEIYDLQGRRVRTLTDASYEGASTIPGHYQQGYFDEGARGWDGRDEFRRLVPAGVYVCRLEATDSDGRVSAAIAPAVVGVRLN
jgi:hypothetical protein